MKKTINLLLAGILIFGLAACEEQEINPDGTPDETPEDTETPGDNANQDENGDGANTDNLHKVEFPFYEAFPIECGNLLTEGSDVGVTIEVTRVEDKNFVFELRPGAMVQSFKMDVYPIAQLYNNLLNDRNSGMLEVSGPWNINARIRDYLFNESGSGGYAFSISDFDNPEDFLQIEYDWMNTAYAAASAIAIPDCGYLIAVVASAETEITNFTYEDLTLCYVHTSSQPLIGDPQCEIEVNTGYTAFGVQHHLNADAAAVYFFGYLSSEIDEYIDIFGDTMFRDFVRTRVTSPAVADDPNNPESLYYSVNYGQGADSSVMSTTVAVAVDANLTPQADYTRVDFHLDEMPPIEEQPVAQTGFRIPEDRIGATYAEWYIDLDKETQAVYYLFYTEEEAQATMALSAKEQMKLAINIATVDGYGCTNENFAWDKEAKAATGSDYTEYVEGVLVNIGFKPGETYRVVYTSRNGYQQLSPLQFSEPFTMDTRNYDSPDACKADISLKLDQPTRTSFRSLIEFDPATVSVIHIQYMTEDLNPGFWTDASWEQWIDFIFFPEKYWDEQKDYAPIVMEWPTLLSGLDVFTWTAMTPDTNYTVFMCAEDFDGNISEMQFATIRTSEIQVGPDPTVNMALVPASHDPYDWSVTFTIDHDVEYYLYCTTNSASDLAMYLPGINKSHLNDIANSPFTYEQWSDALYEWVAGGSVGDGAGMRTQNNTSLDWEGEETVIAACIAVGRKENGDPEYKMYHLICKDGKAQTLEEIFGVN